jgi:hypothetical protein
MRSRCQISLSGENFLRIRRQISLLATSLVRFVLVAITTLSSGMKQFRDVSLALDRPFLRIDKTENIANELINSSD